MPDSPNEVERFMGPISSSLQPEADGCWVRYEDHQRHLQAEVEKREEVEGALTDLQCEQAKERLAAESKLSSVVEEVEKLIGAEAEFYEKARRAKDRDGQVVHGVARDSLLEVRKLLRDKGTEPCKHCGETPGHRCNCPVYLAEVRPDLLEDPPVAIEGDPGLEEGEVAREVDRRG